MFICWTKPSGRIKKIRKANQLSKTHFDFSFLLPLSFFPFLYLGYIWGVMQDKLQIRMNSIISPCYSSFSFWNISNKWTNMENNVTVIKDPSSAPMNINFSPYLLRGFVFLGNKMPWFQLKLPSSTSLCLLSLQALPIQCGVFQQDLAFTRPLGLDPINNT